MGLRFEQVDADEAREAVRAIGDAEGYWPGDDHTWWTLTDDKDGLVGVCSAVVRPTGYVYLGWGAVHPAARGKNLQQRMIRHRLRWGKRQGALWAVTYTLVNNYPSIMNLLKAGMRFASKPRGWVGVDGPVHYFDKSL